MVVAGPSSGGMHADGRRVDTPITVIDLFPTLLDFAGVRMPPAHEPSVDGASIAGLLRDGDDVALPRDRGLAWHMPHQWGASGPGIEPFTSYRRERWKLLFFHDGPRVELYDLETDLGETLDLADDRPDVVDRMLLELDEWMTATDADLSRDATTGASIARPATLVRTSTD